MYLKAPCIYFSFSFIVPGNKAAVSFSANTGNNTNNVQVIKRE